VICRSHGDTVSRQQSCIDIVLLLLNSICSTPRLCIAGMSVKTCRGDMELPCDPALSFLSVDVVVVVVVVVGCCAGFELVKSTKKRNWGGICGTRRQIISEHVPHFEENEWSCRRIVSFCPSDHGENTPYAGHKTVLFQLKQSAF
jgi:hypothetical protein